MGMENQVQVRLEWPPFKPGPRISHGATRLGKVAATQTGSRALTPVALRGSWRSGVRRCARPAQAPPRRRGCSRAARHSR